MSDELKANEQDDNLMEVENVEIAPLSDEDLDAVSGGASELDGDCTGCVTTGCCTTGSDAEVLA